MRKMIYEPFGGLCNRLRNMDYIFQVKDRLHLDEFRLFWFNDRNCGCNAEDIISVPVPYQNQPFPKHSIKECMNEKDIPGLFTSAFNNARYRAIQKKYKDHIIDDADYLYDPEMMLQDMEKTLNEGQTLYFRGCHNPMPDRDYSWLKFRPELVDQADRDLKGCNDYISVHIRRTDHKLCILESPTYVFFDFLDGILSEKPDQMVYLATDDDELLKEAERLYHDNMVPHRSLVLDRTSKEGICDAVTEFLILSRSKKVFGSSSSSYSEEAAYFGGVPFEILTIYNYQDAIQRFISEETNV